jgi:hypothetical protein
MTIKDYVGKTIYDLYIQVIESLKPKTLDIIFEKPPFGDGAGMYVHEANGNYIIYITPEHLSDYVLSHELLHIKIVSESILPSLISFESDSNETSMRIAILFSDSIVHKWIINEQRRLLINGESEFVEKAIEGFKNQTYIEAGKASTDFNAINMIFTFLNDFPEHSNLVSGFLMERYPFSFTIAKRLLEETVSEEIISPFQARRLIINKLKMYKDILESDGIDCGFLDEDITVKPVIREVQLERLAETILDVIESEQKYYFVTNYDNQKCCAKFTNQRVKSISEIKSILGRKLLGEVFSETKIPYYIDDRNGNWKTIHVI